VTASPPTQALAALILRPVPTWTFFGYFGEEQVDRDESFRLSDGKTFGYGYGNLLFDNSAARSRAASTDINITMASFRYYPFQK
jgi:hypothetical protein